MKILERCVMKGGFKWTDIGGRLSKIEGKLGYS